MLRAAFAIFLLVTAAIPALGSEPWWAYALRLTGEKEKVRQSSIETLRKTPGLEQTLRDELKGERRFLALDVITALKLRGMTEDLLKLSESDSTGLFYASLNTLIDDRSIERTRAVYRARAFSATTAPAAKLVLIDTLARMGEMLSEREVSSLLDDASYEVRGAALGYLRHRVLALGDPNALAWGKKGFDEQPWQLRLQYMYLVSEAPIQAQRGLTSFVKSCRKDASSEVSALCAKIEERIRR